MPVPLFSSLFSQYHQRRIIRALPIPQTTQANVVASERAIAVPLLIRNLQANGFMEATDPKTKCATNGDESNNRGDSSSGTNAARTSIASSSSSKSRTDSSEHSSESGDKHSAAAIPEDVAVKRGSCQAATLDWGRDPLPQFSAPLQSVQDEQPSIELRSKEGTKTSSSSHYDVVVGADLAFPSNSGNYDVLADILAEALGATTASAANRRSGGAGEDEVHSDEAETPPLLSQQHLHQRHHLHHHQHQHQQPQPRVEGWLAHETRRPEVERILLGIKSRFFLLYALY